VLIHGSQEDVVPPLPVGSHGGEYVANRQWEQYAVNCMSYSHDLLLIASFCASI
jgi:hypothetical protein